MSGRKRSRARAHRIEVDACDACPFSVYAECRHPATEGRTVYIGEAPPQWCPLRGAVTMIAGPSSLAMEEK